jgi:hypothetical protein
MSEHGKSVTLQCRHWISFASGEEPFALLLPDRRLYEAFASWLRGEGAQGYSFPHEGQEMAINFAHVQRMEVEIVKDPDAALSRGDLVVPLTVREPAPVV